MRRAEQSRGWEIGQFLFGFYGAARDELERKKDGKEGKDVSLSWTRRGDKEATRLANQQIEE